MGCCENESVCGSSHLHQNCATWNETEEHWLCDTCTGAESKAESDSDGAFKDEISTESESSTDRESETEAESDEAESDEALQVYDAAVVTGRSLERIRILAFAASHGCCCENTCTGAESKAESDSDGAFKDEISTESEFTLTQTYMADVKVERRDYGFYITVKRIEEH